MSNHTINKVTYNNSALIDLSEDTVTRADVDNGIYFHLADGTRTTGTNTDSDTSVFTKTGAVSPASTTLTLSDLVKEPTWFILYFTSITARADPLCFVFYNGEDVIHKRMNSKASSANVRVWSAIGDTSFSYSNGSLTISNSIYYFTGSYTFIYG